MPAEPTKRRPTAIHRWFRRHKGAVSWGIVSLATVLTLVLGVIGFSETVQTATPISTRIYLAFQLLTLESGALQDRPSINWPLQTARWTGVIASLGIVLNTLVLVFSRQIDTLLLRRLTNHAVVIGMNADGIQLASDLLEDGFRVTVIDDEENNPEINALIERGACEVIGDAQEPEILEAAATHNAHLVAIVDGSDIRNLEVVLGVFQSLDKRMSKLTPLQCHVHTTDHRLRELMDCHSHDQPVETTVFDRFSNSARLLLARTPLDRERIVPGDRRHVHLVISELTALGEALLLHALAVGHFANCHPLRVTVIDEAASQKEQLLLAKCPGLHDCGEITFIDGYLDQVFVRDRLRELVVNPMELVSIAICQEDPQRALTSCMNLIPLLTETNNTVFVNLAEDERVATILKQVPESAIRLFPFGNAKQACSASAVIRNDLDTLARSIHDEYRGKRARDGDSPENYPAMRPWCSLSVDLRDANRQQADHIPVKLRALGYRMVEAATVKDITSFQISEDEIEALARAEHLRWCCNRRLAGWKSGSPRDDTAKIHPNLVPWNELDEPTREYDRESIRNLPELLASIGFGVESD